MPWGDHFAHADALMRLRFANAEQAKHTGGMIALYPRVDDALQLTIPGGESTEELHVTLAYLGEDVSGQSPGGLSQVLDQIAGSFTAIQARIMGHATFNGDGGPGGDMDPCAVYLVSDSKDMDDLHSEVSQQASEQFNLPEQHAPWIPHITAGYGIDANRLSFHGPITFDRIGLRFGGQSRDFPLL